MDWQNVPDDINNWFGFVYLIERLNAKDGERKYYWGCKHLKKIVKMPPKKGYSRKRKVEKESDWRNYYGSSQELLLDIEKYGKENFKRTILKLCTCKWQLKYEELKLQMENNVLLRDDCYNSIVNLRINKCPKALKEFYSNQLKSSSI